MVSPSWVMAAQSTRFVVVENAQLSEWSKASDSSLSESPASRLPKFSNGPLPIPGPKPRPPMKASPMPPPMNPPQPGPSCSLLLPLLSLALIPVGTNALVGAELPTKLLLVAPKLSGAEMRAAAACEEATGEVALSVAHAAMTAPALAIIRILSGLGIECLQKLDCASFDRRAIASGRRDTRGRGYPIRGFSAPFPAPDSATRAPGGPAVPQAPAPFVSPPS